MRATSPNILDVVAEDLAVWIQDIADQLADGMSAGGRVPFSVPLTEQQKMDYYTAQLFNRDGTPNVQGRAAEMQRLGPEQFATVYKAVLKAHPDLAIPAPPAGAQIGSVPFPTAVPAGPKLAGLPSSLGIPRMSSAQTMGEAALSSIGPAAGVGPLG